MSIDGHVTISKAADFLNVSECYLASLLDEGMIPHDVVGGLRYIRRQDLIAFKAAAEQRRGEIMQQLADQAQVEGMGY